jgi:hypothetical protein
MNEQEETELQVLQSIWEDDFIVQEPRLYRAILRPDEHITLALEFDCRNTDYPNAIPMIKIRLMRGNIISMYKEYLERTLSDSAYEKLGLPMMYDLIEQAKQEIEVNDLTQGSIGILVPDTLLQIFKLLNYRNLTCCGVVNKKWRQITFNDRLWKRMCSDLEFVAGVEKLSPIHKSDNQSYHDYFTILRKSVLKHLFNKHQNVLSIHSDPTGSVEYMMTPVNFAENVVNILLSKYNAQLRQCGPEMLSFQSWNWYGGGTLTFYNVSQAERLFATSPWYDRALNLHKELKCPYVGPVVGFVAMQSRLKREDLLKLFFRYTRGILVNISLPGYSECSVVKSVQKYEIDMANNAHFLPAQGQNSLVEDLNGQTKLCKELRRVLKDSKGVTSVIQAEFWHIDETITTSSKMRQGFAAEESFAEFAKELLESNPNVRQPQEKPIIYK